MGTQIKKRTHLVCHLGNKVLDFEVSTHTLNAKKKPKKNPKQHRQKCQDRPPLKGKKNTLCHLGEMVYDFGSSAQKLNARKKSLRQVQKICSIRNGPAKRKINLNINHFISHLGNIVVNNFNSIKCVVTIIGSQQRKITLNRNHFISHLGNIVVNFRASAHTLHAERLVRQFHHGSVFLLQFHACVVFSKM